ncbi:MAG: hypothetical protein AAF717_16645 [Bacteroidota bacterium]
MKKFLTVFAIAGLLFSCSDDDSTGGTIDTPDPIDEDPTGEASVVLNEVTYLAGEVELYNNGDLTVDVSDYFLCLGPGTYDRVGDIIASGNANLAAGEFLVLNYDRPGATGGLGLYINNAGFGDAANIADFVQWGDAGSARENVAVDAGIWTEGDFVDVSGNENNSIVYDGEGEASSDWAETATVTLGAANVVTAPEEAVRSVIINEVEYLVNDEIELYNNGNQTVDLANYWMCLGPGQYFRIGDSEATTVVSGSINLAPGEFLVISPVTLTAPDDAGGLGLYANNDSFGDATNIRSFVQWGASGNARESVAVEAGIWNAGGYVPNVSPGSSIAYDGEGNTSDDWAATVTPTLGAANEITAPARSIVINEVEYLVNDQIELYNNGNETVDLSTYWMCLGPGQYFRIGDTAATDIVSGNVTLAPGEFLVISPIVLTAPDDAGGLGLYANNDGFGDPANIRSFVQWGASGNARESVAVSAGIWNAGGYVPNAAPGQSIAYDGEGNSSEDWAATTTPTLGAANEITAPPVRSIVINEVEYLINDEIELWNNGEETVDLSTYWMCLGPGQYFRIGDAAATTIVSGNLNLAPGEFLVIAPVTLSAPDDAGGLGLYANNDGFGDAANIRSFVQWGASGNARESVAVTAGIWDAGGFVPNVASGSSIAWDGEGFTSNDWNEDNTPTLGSGNASSSSSSREGGSNDDGGYYEGTDTGKGY